MYRFNEIVEKIGGKQEVKRLVEVEGYTYPELREVLSIPKASNVVMGKLLTFCETTIPYPRSTKEFRLWALNWERDKLQYWENKFLVEVITKRLTQPVLNRTGESSRYNIAMWGHPRANKDSHEVRAHIIVWELENECFLPDGYEVYPLDNNFLNLLPANLSVRTSTERKKFYALQEKNFFFKTGVNRSYNYTRKWVVTSKSYKNSRNNTCELCASTDMVVAHHIISYFLFPEQDLRVHTTDNLLCVCKKCHYDIHFNSLNIKPLISEKRYSKLLELLESLKSLVSDSMMETYIEVEKQLGLTGNQQPSP